MVYLFALAAGLFAAALLVIGGAAGYSIAQAPSSRGALIAVAGVAVVLVAAAGSTLAALTYSRLGPVAAVTPPAQMVSSPSPNASPSTEPTSDTSGAPQPATDAWLHFQSDTGDFIGAGVLKVWTLKESNFSLGGTNSYLRASVSGLGDWWYLDFRAPSTGHLVPGQFDNAERAPFVTGKAPGLEVDGDGRGCNTLSGRFVIKSLTWTQAAGVAAMDVLFEQHCEGMTPALRGELWFTTLAGVHKAPPPAASTISF